jgi:hypothetical protein
MAKATEQCDEIERRTMRFGKAGRSPAADLSQSLCRLDLDAIFLRLGFVSPVRKLFC